MDQLQKIPVKVFLPVSKLLILWYSLLLFIISFDFVTTIIVICFQNSTSKIILYDYINIVLFPLLVFDILLTFNTGFIKDGKLILIRKNIIRNYIKSVYFWVDVWSAIWSFIQILVVHALKTQFPYLTLLAFVKIVKIKAIDSLIVKYILRSSDILFYYQILKNLFFLALVCHVFGSLYFLIDVQMIKAGWYANSPNGYGFWLLDSFCYPDILNQQFWIQYTYSFYFIIVTLAGVAYGDLVPLNPTQTAYVFGCVAFPILIYAYLFSVIYSAIAQQRSKRTTIFRTRLNSKYYFQNLGIKNSLRYKLLNYIAYYYKNKLTSSNQFINDLAPSLRFKYKVEALQNKLDLSIFNPFGWTNFPQFVSKIVKEQFVPQRYKLGKQNKLVYLNQGTIIQYIKMKSKYSKKATKDSFIGQYAFFTGILTDRVNIQTSQFTICQTIQYSKFKQNLKQNAKQLNESYCLIRDQVILYGKVSLIRHQCFFCSEKQHHLDNCPHLRGNIIIQSMNYKGSARNNGSFVKYKRNNLKMRKVIQHNALLMQQQNHREFIIKRNSNLVDHQIQIDISQKSHQIKDIQYIKKWSLKYYPVFNIF